MSEYEDTRVILATRTSLLKYHVECLAFIECTQYNVHRSVKVGRTVRSANVRTIPITNSPEYKHVELPRHFEGRMGMQYMHWAPGADA